MRINVIIMTGFVLFLIFAAGPVAWPTEPEHWITEAEEAYGKIEGYTAIFHKQERIDGELQEEETILFKFRRPFKVYMKWIKGPHAGRELLYVEGWNDGRIRIHEGGLKGIVTVNLAPHGSLATRGNRHPITESGIGHLVKLIGENLRKGISAGGLKFREHGRETVFGRKTDKVEIVFSEARSKGYYCYRTIINLDVEQKAPIKIEIYDWDNILIEVYGYEGLNFNPGPTDDDFDPKNPEYKFR